MNIIAHRGASTYAPENTLAAFQKALDQGADGIELDVRLTKDNVPVICHDATVNRTSNGKGFIHNMTLNQLKKLDFGSTFSKKFKGETIPTLDETLSLIGDKPITIHIELKNGPVIPKDLERKVLDLVYRHGVEHKVVYSSFDHVSLQRLTNIDPNAKIGLLFHINLINLFDYIQNTGLHIYSIHPNHFYVTEEMIDEAHERNIEVNIYTVNNRDQAKIYQGLGIDGLITNDPLILK
ncbi:glycerophosphodiester phosphodiesterase [Pseudogracilibacillus sp. SO30301A]|uniref:glycerophosphodiester phosphodiesterase n=1 Tax=Pseudogracilibacillus sp. SO30301A TaxID=3098291 RepID=UPI00300DFF21